MSSQQVEKRTQSLQTREFKSKSDLQNALSDKEYEGRVAVIYEESLYDVTDFLDAHPGGKEIITKYNKKDITEQFTESHGESESAKRILSLYKVGSSAQKDQKKLPEYYPKLQGKHLIFEDFEIDLGKGYFNQIWKLNHHQFLKVINNPVTVPFYVPLLDTKILDSLTNTPWYIIPIIWLPIAFYNIYLGLTTGLNENSSLTDSLVYLQSSQFSYVIVGLILFFAFMCWSISEYSLHRFVFHMEKWMPDFAFFRYLAFAIHGIHHALPMDGGRLVFPPAAAAILYQVVYPLIRSIAPGNTGLIFLGGFLIGYVYYDLTHYYLHHADPMTEHHRMLKSAHNKHHYINDTKGFGISTKIWDRLFKTGFDPLK